MTSRRVMRPRNRQQRKRPFIPQFLHPGLEFRRGEDRKEGPAGDIHNREIVRPVGQFPHNGGLGAHAGHIGFVAVVALGAEGEAYDFVG